MTGDEFDHVRANAMRTADRHGRIWPRDDRVAWNRRAPRIAPVLSLITALAALGFVVCAVAAFNGH